MHQFNGKSITLTTSIPIRAGHTGLLLYRLRAGNKDYLLNMIGGLGPAAKTFHKRLASLIAEKQDQPYSLTLL